MKEQIPKDRKRGMNYESTAVPVECYMKGGMPFALSPSDISWNGQLCDTYMTKNKREIGCTRYCT